MASLPVTQSIRHFHSGGRPIALDCFLPHAPEKRHPAVIALHGSGGGHYSIAEPAGMLAAQGFAVYVLHYFDRTGTTDAHDRAVIFRHFPAWAKTLWDAVSHVSSEPGVDPSRIGLLGFSLGAYLSLSVAAVDSRVRAVVDFFGGLPKEIKFFMKRLPPCLILHGDADLTVPVAEAFHLQEVLQARGVPYEIKIYPGVGHGFSGDIWRDAGLRTLHFLQKYLAAEPAPSGNF
jgi:carboxymethylenebutenolidase